MYIFVWDLRGLAPVYKRTCYLQYQIKLDIKLLTNKILTDRSNAGNLICFRWLLHIILHK